MMFLRGKERRVDELYRAHIQQVDDCLQKLGEVLNLFLKRDPSYRDVALELHHSEHRADMIRREIEKSVHEGAFLAVFRGDFIWLAESIDKIANLSEAIADIMVTERPDIPDELADSFRDLFKASAAAFDPFKELKGIVSNDSSDVLAQARAVEEQEQVADKLEFKLMDQLFSSELDLAHKLHLKDLIKRLGALANLAEDASDRLEVMMAKRMV